MKFQITFLGANSFFGRVASALLSKTPSVRTLKLYDEVENHLQGPNSGPTCVVQWHRGKDELTTAIEGSDIVVIGDSSKLVFCSERDATLSTASKVVDFVYAVAQTAPKAMVVVAASPLNLMVPLAGYVLKELGCYDGRKLLGVTSVDTLRANAIYSEYIAQPNSILPVVGGASPQTRVPIFSQARPNLDLPEEDMHRLIDKIKSFDLNMEGSELKASTLERAYATVRLINSLLSGLQEEPCTKEMALAKTSLIPEVNYFSLPVDLGKFGIERTFGLPPLSVLETEMMDYAIINLNNDLMKAQDLYSSFKPCFEMMKSIVGDSKPFNDLTKQDDAILSDYKIEKKRKRDHNIKSNRRKRSESHFRNRRRTRANKFPILHCPAPEVVADKPVEEKFGKIERVHKKLQVNQVLKERNPNELPVLYSNEVESQSTHIEAERQLKGKKMEVMNNPVEKERDRNNKNNDLLPALLNSKEATEVQLSSCEIIDLIDIENNSKAMHKAVEETIASENKLESMKTLRDDTEVRKNVTVTIDLNCKIKNNKLYENLQPHTEIKTSSIETIKSLMLEKQKQYQKTNFSNSSNSTTRKNKIEYLNKKAMELKPFCNPQSLKTPIFTNPQSSEKNKGAIDKSNNDEILGKETNKHLNMEELPGLEINEKTNNIVPENDSDLEKQNSLLNKSIEEQNGTDISVNKIKGGIETKFSQEMGIPKDEVIATKEKKQDDTRNQIGNKVDASMVKSKTNGKNHQEDQKEGTTAGFENLIIGEQQEQVHDSNSLKEETFEKSFKEDQNALKILTCNESERNIQPASADKNNILTVYKKASKLKKKKIIQAEKVTVTEVENEMNNNSIDCILSKIGSEKCNEIETDDKKIKIKSRAETTKEGEKQLIKANIHDVTKEENENIDEEMSKQVGETADSDKTEGEISNENFSLTSGHMLSKEKAVIDFAAHEKLEELEQLNKMKKGDKVIKRNQKISVANISEENCDSLEQENKIREITKRNLKEPLKYPKLTKQEKASETEETVVDEEANVIDESKVPENIEVFKYEPKNMKDTRHITNINEMIQSLVKLNKPEANSEQTCVDQSSIYDVKDEVHVVSKQNKVKVINLKKKAEQLIIKHKQKLKKDDKQVNASIDLGSKKSPKEPPFPFLNKAKEMPKVETFDKSNWLKLKITPNTKGISPARVKLKTIDESNAVTINSRKINESFTKRIQQSRSSNKTTEDAKSVSYTIDTKSKRDELSKRYTVLKKGQLCNMVKDDINANELKAKLYQSTFKRNAIKPSVKLVDNKITDTKDLSFTELLKSPTNLEISYSEPSLNVLEAVNEVSNNITSDSKNIKIVKNNNNNNAMSLKNKSFLNFVVNRISKTSPPLNEKTETLGVRGSHYGSGTYSKNPATSNELKIQQHTKKAKDQLKITKFKNNKRISSGLSGGLPVVSYEFGEKRQPVIDKKLDKNKSNNDLAENIVRSRNKIQQMKEKYQRLKNVNLPPKNVYAMSPPSGAEFIRNKVTKKVDYGKKNSITESGKSTSKSNPEPKCEKSSIKQDDVLKQSELSSIENSGKEIAKKASEKPQSEAHDQVTIEKDDSLIDVNNTHPSEVHSDNNFLKTEEKCSDISESIPNPNVFEDNITIVIPKKSSQEDQESLQEKNKSVKECFDKEQELNKAIQEDNSMGKTKSLKEETISNIEKINKSSSKQFTPGKKVFPDKAHEIKNFKSKENIKNSKDMFPQKDSPTTASKENPQKSNVKLAQNNAPMRLKFTKKKINSLDKNSQSGAQKAIFSSRPTAGDLIQIKQGQKTCETDKAKGKTHKVTPLNFGVRTVVDSKVIPRHSTASSLLLDPDIEKRPANSRKEIHPSLLHAVKPFHSKHSDLTKLKTNFYSRWTPQGLKLKEDKEGDTKFWNEGVPSNPFVSGKINLTSDVFKAYMKKNRNYEFTNSNGDVQFLHQSVQLASVPQQGVTANMSRINDQRVAFSTLEANAGKQIIPSNKNPQTSTDASSYRFHNKAKASIVEKTAKAQKSFKNPMRSNKILKESPSKELSSSKSRTVINPPKNKLTVHKFNEKQIHSFNPFRYKEKEADLKRMHLLKAFQNQETNEMKFEELQRNYKKQLNKTSANTFKPQPKETQNRLQMLKRRSVESVKDLASEESRKRPSNKRPFSAPADYHPSFPLSKSKKYERNNNKEESGNTLKRRWTQLLDIFQSVITTEKKNWEDDNPDKNLLSAGGSHLTKNAVIPKAKIILRETLHNSNSTAKRVQSYYRRHLAGGPKFQNNYTLSNRTSKM